MVTRWLATSSDRGTTFSETMIGVPFNLQGARAPTVSGSWATIRRSRFRNGFLPFFVAIPQGGLASVFFHPADGAMGAAQAVTLAARSVSADLRGARERWRFGTLFK